MLHLLYAGGLRREEVVTLTVCQVDHRDGRLCLVDLIGKGGRVRTVPLPKWAEEPLLWWRDYRLLVDACAPDDRYITALRGEDMHDRSVYRVVAQYRKLAGIEAKVGPHDLRRTSAKHQLKGGAKLEQISVVLGHASLQTTQRYLGVDLDLEHPACDCLPVPK